MSKKKNQQIIRPVKNSKKVRELPLGSLIFCVERWMPGMVLLRAYRQVATDDWVCLASQISAQVGTRIDSMGLREGIEAAEDSDGYEWLYVEPIPHD